MAGWRVKSALMMQPFYLESVSRVTTACTQKTVG